MDDSTAVNPIQADPLLAEDAVDYTTLIDFLSTSKEMKLASNFDLIRTLLFAFYTIVGIMVLALWVGLAATASGIMFGPVCSMYSLNLLSCYTVGGLVGGVASIAFVYLLIMPILIAFWARKSASMAGSIWLALWAGSVALACGTVFGTVGRFYGGAAGSVTALWIGSVAISGGGGVLEAIARKLARNTDSDINDTMVDLHKLDDLSKMLLLTRVRQLLGLMAGTGVTAITLQGINNTNQSNTTDSSFHDALLTSQQSARENIWRVCEACSCSSSSFDEKKNLTEIYIR